MATSLVLDVAEWAALVSTDVVEPLGMAADATVIPAQLRRRLPAYSRDVARCAMPLLQAAPGCDVVFSSPHGDLASTVTLLTDLAKRELLSPALFSHSVHNAPPGILSLCVADHGDHTAIAGGADTLAAALVEAHARLASAETASLVVVHADERLPPIYAHLDDEAPGVCLAMRLTLVGASADGEVAITEGRDGALALVRALQAGVRRLRFSLPHIEALAA